MRNIKENYENDVINKEDDKYWIWFMSLDISNNNKKKLINQYKSIERIYYEYIYSAKYNENINLEILSNNKKEMAEIYFKYIRKYNIKLIKYTDKIYPKQLLNIVDHPICLFGIGNIDLLKNKCVAIVGARDSSEYGKNITADISNILSKKGYTIVSGLAKGIDKIAHISTIKYNTIAVIGSGITKKTFYPKENYNLFLEIIKHRWFDNN